VAGTQIWPGHRCGGHADLARRRCGGHASLAGLQMWPACRFEVHTALGAWQTGRWRGFGPRGDSFPFRRRAAQICAAVTSAERGHRQNVRGGHICGDGTSSGWRHSEDSPSPTKFHHLHHPPMGSLIPLSIHNPPPLHKPVHE